MVILGIDPGSNRIGYGAIEKIGGKFKYLESGLIKLPKESHKERLVALEKNLEELLEKIKPDKIGLEKLFFVKNQKSAFLVAQARGVILNTIAKKKTPVLEVGPNEVKLSVAGDGRANKKSVAKMVSYFLNITFGRNVFDDVSDALAIAIAVSNK